MSLNFGKMLSDVVSDVSRISKMEENRDVEGLIRILKEEKNNRNSAALALGDIGDARAVEPLIQALKDKNAGVRRVVADALGKIKDERVIEPLIQALEDRDDDVRFRAAEALTKALEHYDEDTQEAARKALEKIRFKKP